MVDLSPLSPARYSPATLMSAADPSVSLRLYHGRQSSSVLHTRSRSPGFTSWCRRRPPGPRGSLRGSTVWFCATACIHSLRLFTKKTKAGLPVMTEKLPVLSVPTTYVSLPVTIKAVQWDGTARHAADIIDWIHEHGRNASYMCNEPNRPCTKRAEDHHLIIRTLEGNMDAEPGAWIIQGTEGEFYPCKDSVFQRKYRQSHGAPEINVTVPVINIQGGAPGVSPEAVARQMAKRLGVERG